TSSISPGSTPARASRPFRTCAASSSPRIEDSVPFFFPIGERTASTISASGIQDRVEAPGPHALQLVLAALLERDPGTRDQVLDRAGHEHFAAFRERGDACSGGDRNSGDLSFVQLALAA